METTDAEKIRKLARNFTFKNNLLWYNRNNCLRLCVPECRALKLHLFFTEHDEPTKGHPGIFKTVDFIKRKYYWRGMDKEIRDYVMSCEKCQRNKFRQSRAPGLLQSLPVPEARWQHITMDFITSLPVNEMNEYNSIWVICDRLTKRAHFIPVSMGKDGSSARICAQLFIREYQRLHGIPETIVSDRDTRFNNEFWQSLMELQGCKHILSSAFRPNTDGQTERTNRFIEDYLRNYVFASQDNWSRLLSIAEFAYNSRIHSAIGMSPFVADLGYIPRCMSDINFDRIHGTVGNKEIVSLLHAQQRILKIAQDAIKEAQSRMAKYYNRNRPIQNFEIGDLVLVSTKNLNIEHLGISTKGIAKLGPVWIGPYPVLSKTTPDTYKLRLPLGLKLHDEFHTSLLKPYVQDKDPLRINKPNEGMIAAGGVEDAYLLENVVGHRQMGNKIQYLVKWVGYSDSDNTWEDLSNIVKPASALIGTYVNKHKLSRAIWFPSIKNRKKT